MIKNAVAVLLSAVVSAAVADDDAPLPRNASFKTLITTDLAIEGLTGDRDGNLYTTGRATGTRCPVWRINIANPSLVVVGTLPAGCQASGITFDALGNLYVADSAGNGTVWKLEPSAQTPPEASAYATDVPGTNGLAFDSDGELWTGDGTTGLGRVWKIRSAGASCQPLPPAQPADCIEAFRIQPMRNGADLGGDLPTPGVGRQNNTVPTNNSQNLVANGLAFDDHGDLYVADTARGAIWKVQFDARGALKSRVNCDTTFTDNTLCLENIFVAHPFLEGTDGIALDRAGNIWNSANERNAIVVVTRKGAISEVFRNPPNTARLRNSADSDEGNKRILETPTSPFLLGSRFCTANSDGNRRDNAPNTAGEISPAGDFKGKISCMDQELGIPGLPLPVR